MDFYLGGRTLKLDAVSAFTIVMLLLAAGEFVSQKTKAFIPSVFVTAILFLFGYWTVLPTNIVELASFTKPVVFLSIALIITHMGTLMSITELSRQWKTVLISIAAIVGIIASCMTVGVMLFGWENAVAATPPITGGIVAAILMSEAAAAKGLPLVAVLAISTYIMQGFFGYPLTALMLKKETKRLVAQVRSGEVDLVTHHAAQGEDKKSKWRIFPPVPEEYESTYVVLLQVGILALISVQLAPLLHVNQFVLCLFAGVIGRATGFVRAEALVKPKAFGWLLTVVMAFIFGSLAQATPTTLAQIALPMFGLLTIGVIGMAILSAIVGHFVGETKEMAASIAMTCLYGFPADYILTIEAIKSTAANKEEYDYCMSHMMPKMLVGGFVTVTSASVIVAGYFVTLL